jgi:hypothetical protein
MDGMNDELKARAAAMLKKSTRDIQVHAAVTIMPNKNNVWQPGEKDVEIAQFAVQLDSAYAPFTAEMVRKAFEGLEASCLSRMRAAGLLRAGE